MRGSLEIAVEDAALRGTERLARFFPDVRRVTIPAIVELRHGVHLVLRHAVWIEFAGANVVIFFCGLPLEFEDRVSMENDRGQAFTAKVVAVQYHHGMNGVAVQIQDDRFAG